MYITATMNHFNLLCAIVKSFSNIERLSLQTEVFSEVIVPIEGDQDPESHPQFCTSSLQDRLTLSVYLTTDYLFRIPVSSNLYCKVVIIVPLC